jgi:hypothetical protein
MSKCLVSPWATHEAEKEKETSYTRVYKYGTYMKKNESINLSIFTMCIERDFVDLH